MIYSMTGFGEATAEVDDIVYAVEIKTVNNRYSKIHLRLPEMASFLDGEIEALLRKQIHRGTVNCSLRMKNVSGQALFEVNEKALAGYMGKLKDMVGSNDLNCQIDLTGMLALPGIVQPAVPDQQQADKMKSVILELVKKAIDQLRQTRTQEGQMLLTEMTENCELMKKSLKSIRERSPIVVKEYHSKLEKRIKELSAEAQLEIDADLLAREAVIFADRCDIAEELARLDSHLQQFVMHSKDGQNAGRRLDFISQEMLREANTIASKASDAKISQQVIDIKCAIDRIKEQVQNVE